MSSKTDLGMIAARSSWWDEDVLCFDAEVEDTLVEEMISASAFSVDANDAILVMKTTGSGVSLVLLILMSGVFASVQKRRRAHSVRSDRPRICLFPDFEVSIPLRSARRWIFESSIVF